MGLWKWKVVMVHDQMINVLPANWRHFRLSVLGIRYISWRCWNKVCETDRRVVCISLQTQIRQIPPAVSILVQMTPGHIRHCTTLESCIGKLEFNHFSQVVMRPLVISKVYKDMQHTVKI